MFRSVLKNLSVVVVILCSCFLSVTSYSDVTGLEKELDRLNELYSSVQSSEDWDSKSDSAKVFAREVKWSGVSNEILFDRVKKDLLKKDIKISARQRSYYNEYISWMVQALAFSGIEKYDVAIEQFTDTYKYSSKIVRHAKSSLDALEEFARWNSEINRGLEQASLEELPRKRLINLITSDIPQLKRVGARLAIAKYRGDAQVMGLIESELLSLYLNTKGERMPLDAASWMCRALGESGDKKYIPTLEKVEKESRDKPVRNWAKKSKRALSGYKKPARQRL